MSMDELSTPKVPTGNDHAAQDEVLADCDHAQDALAAFEEALESVLQIEDDEFRLVVLSELLDGATRRALEGERQKLDPWGRWMHSTLLDTARPGEHETAETRKHVDRWEDANVLYSQKLPEVVVEGLDAQHVVALDIDLPMRVVPSTHPGRGHLWINKVLPWSDVTKLLRVLVEVGIVAASYEEHSLRRGYTCLRPAFIDKKPWSWSSDTDDPAPDVTFVDGED